MNKYSYYFFKGCKKIKVNKLIYKISSIFVNEDKQEKIDIKAFRDELNNYYPFKETRIISKNNVKMRLYDLQIIVPVYNVEKELRKCLESIINQKTKYKYCIYIVNDGSTDSCLSIMKQYEKMKNITIINQSNQGLAAARNSGFKEIVGKYLMFVDSDDYISDDAVEKLLDTAYKNDADIVEGSYISYNDNKRYTFINKTTELKGHTWNKIYKSTLFENLIFPKGYLYEDTMPFFMIYPFANKICILEDITYYHLINNKGIALLNKGEDTSIDSYWLTEELDKCRYLLNYPNDINYWILLNRQFIMNYSRTCYLPENIQKDIFFLEKNLLNNNFKEPLNNDEIMLFIYNGEYNKYINYMKWN